MTVVKHPQIKVERLVKVTLKKKSSLQIFIALLFSVTSSLSFALSKLQQAAKAEQQLRIKIESMIGKKLEEKYYYLFIKVDETKIPDENKSKDIPFSNLKIDPKKLEEALLQNSEIDLFTLTYEVQVVFDPSVPTKKQELIVSELKHILKINDTERKISVTQEQILKVDEVVNTAAKDIEIETLKLESEKVKLEKEKLEYVAKQKEVELGEQLRRKEDQFITELKQKEEQIKSITLPKDDKKPDEVKKIEEKKEAEKEKTAIDHIKDFQIAILASVIGLVILVASVLSGIFRKNSMSVLSKSLEVIGENLGKASASQTANQTNQTNDSVSKDVETNADSKKESSKEIEHTQHDEKYHEFLQLVEEKITVLSREGNLAFYRHFIDLIDENALYASAILVSVSSEIAKVLVENISQDHVAKIKNCLGEEGGLAKAQNLRGQSLQEFYGKISLDEFTSSPLINIRNIGWFSKLKNSEMLSIAMEMKAEERTKFLACLTPGRLISIMNSSTDAKIREEIINSIQEADKVDTHQIEQVFVVAKNCWENINKNSEVQAKKLIDGPRFFAKMIQDLKGDARASLIAKLSSRSELMEQIKQYYIPFKDVEKLTADTIKDIFSKRPTAQIAIILYAADVSVRSEVINSMAEMLRDTIKEEITSLEADKAKEAQNRAKSLELQDEVCRYLLKLNKEGLLLYKEASDGVNKENTALGNAA